MTNQPEATAGLPQSGRIMGRSYGAVEASTVDGKSSELLTVDVY